MILDIDHIALSSTDFLSFENYLKKLNYYIVFNEKEIENLKTKKKFMKNFPPTHDLCLLNSKFNLNIELLKYDKINNENGFITPIFEYAKKNNYIDEFIEKLKLSKIPYNIKESNQDFNFTKFKIRSNNILESEGFWERLGFKKINKKNHYEFKSIISSKKYEVFFESVQEKNNYFLDNRAWNSIAFLTNSIESEKKRFEKDFITSDIESLIINKKELKIFFVKGPSNELVEIISPT